jgi:hypothetical protein
LDYVDAGRSCEHRGQRAFLRAEKSDFLIILIHGSMHEWYETYHMGVFSQMTFKHLTSAQIRAARALLRWSAEDLARESAIGVTTIRRAEITQAETSMTAANDLAVRRALENAGVEFIDENGGGPGVRLRKQKRPKKLK